MDQNLNNTQANMDLEEAMDILYQGFEDGQDTNKIVDTIVASTGLSMEIVGKIQAEASRLYSKNCF